MRLPWRLDESKEESDESAMVRRLKEERVQDQRAILVKLEAKEHS
jgi:hypothetical protein